MAFTILYGILAVAAFWSAIHSISIHVDNADVAAQVGTAIGLTAAFLGSLVTTNLNAYFLWQRLKLRFDSRSITRFTLVVRFDGEFADDAVSHLALTLADHSKFRYPASIQSNAKTEAILTVPRGMTIRMSQETADLSSDGISHIQLRMNELELPARYAVEKLQSQILPLLSTIRDNLGITNVVYDLSFSFEDGNPFFAIYVAHLRPDQVGDFRISLALPSIEANRNDRITVSKTALTIRSGSADTVAKLARDFILLKPDISALRRT